MLADEDLLKPLRNVLTRRYQIYFDICGYCAILVFVGWTSPNKALRGVDGVDAFG
jgi:hypothetical protein